MQRLGCWTVKTLAVVLCMVVGSTSFAQQDYPAIELDIFTTKDYPIPFTRIPDGVSFTVHRVDALEELERELSVGLPADPEAAVAIAMQRIRAMGPALTERGNAGGRILELAYSYGLDRYPATVVNRGEAILYGVVNPVEAAEIYAREVAR